MTYIVTLNAVSLHYYGQGVYGWGPISSTTGQPGQLVQWTMREEAQHWIDTRGQFSRGALVQELP